MKSRQKNQSEARNHLLAIDKARQISNISSLFSGKTPGMKSSSKLDVQGKPKNDELIREIHRVGQANSLKLQHLELAVANLTSICNALRNDLCAMGAQRGSLRKGQLEAAEVKVPSSRSSSTGLDMKDQKLGLKMQQLVDQAAALGILKETKTTPTKVSVVEDVKTSKAQTRAAPRKVQATSTQKSSTKPLVQPKESTTQKKLYSIKLGVVKNVGATQPKGQSSPQTADKTKKPTTTAEVSLKSTVKKTKTTISKVRVTNKSKETTRSNISVQSSVQNVKTIEHKGSIKLKNNAGQGNRSLNATKVHHMIKASSSSGATTMAKSDMKPRRRWSTTKVITSIK